MNPFEKEMQTHIHYHAKDLPRENYNLIIFIRNVSLLRKHIKLHRHRMLKHVKW